MNTRACYRRSERTEWRRKILLALPPSKVRASCSDTKHQLLQSTLPGETWRTLLQTFRTKSSCRCRTTSPQDCGEMCGRRKSGASITTSPKAGTIRESAISRASRWLTKPTSAHPRRTASSGLQIRYEDLHGVEERTIHHFGLRRLNPLLRCFAISSPISMT